MATETLDAIGDLRERIVVQSNTTTPDSQGGRASSWGTFATIWAAVRAQSAAEGEQTEAIRSTVRYEVETRYRADILPTMRIAWTPYTASAAKTLLILGVRMKPGRPERLLIDCAEVA